MNLREARCLFSVFLVALLKWADSQGLHYAFDEVTQHQQKGHMAGSLHYLGCAADILLYDEDGHYLTDDESYKALGEKWKSLHPLCRWGGDFPGDGNHFSFSPPELFGTKA